MRHMTASAFVRMMACCILASVSAAAETRAGGAGPASMPADAAASASTNIAVALRNLSAELKSVRLELIALRAEAQQQTIPGLEQQLQEIHKEQSRRQNDERYYETQLAQLEQVLATHQGGQDERQHLEFTRTSLAEAILRDVRVPLKSLAERESNISRRLNHAKQELHTLKQRLHSE
jgi:hypothetical protein